MNNLQQKYTGEVEAILAKYPSDQKRSAVMPLLFLAQRQRGVVDRQSMNDIAEIVEISTTDVASIAGFYTLYYEEPDLPAGAVRFSAQGKESEGHPAVGKYRIQVCTDLPCALRGADTFLEKLSAYLGIRPGETTADGLITLEEVKCLAACDKAPMFQVQSGDGLKYYENQTIESAMKLVDALGIGG